ncbi:MAG: peptidase M28, partial [Ferruginibacter sp.]
MKKFIHLALAMLCMQNISFAQDDNASRFAATITTNDLKKHLTIIAGEEMEGRETGTEGQRKAATYIESQFKQIGLLSPDTLKGYQQMYPLFQDSLINSELKIRGARAELGKDFYSQASMSENSRFKSKKIVFIGYGIDDNSYTDYSDV